MLALAADDLVAGEATIGTGQAFWTVCFHAQQAAEKSLKALLALDDVVYPYSHDLAELRKMLQHDIPELREAAEEVDALTEYAVEPRYDITIAPDASTTRSALDTARKVYALAEQIIAEREEGEEEPEGDQESDERMSG